MSERKELLSKANKMKPVMQIGKDGLTDSVIEEVKKQLLKKKLIKVKFLKASVEGKKRKELGKEIASLTESELVQQVGFVVVLKK